METTKQRSARPLPAHREAAVQKLIAREARRANVEKINSLINHLCQSERDRQTLWLSNADDQVIQMGDDLIAGIRRDINEMLKTI